MEPTGLIEILEPGPLTLVQDLGRSGYAKYGIAPSGALDPFALRIGNILAGNLDGEAGLEITLPGFKAKVLQEIVLSVTGGNLTPCINDKLLPMWRAQIAHPGNTLSFKGMVSGCRAYLCINGGLAVPHVMGSKSTNVAGRFGGFQGRALQKGDVLTGNVGRLENLTTDRYLDFSSIPIYAKECTLRVLLGPQDEDFTHQGINVFLNSSYKVGVQSNRTGMRLTGACIRHKAGLPESILSEGVLPGAVQVTGEGLPMLLLNETVTGGYRKIATVITADFSLIGQLKPGDKVFFQQVTSEQSLRLLEMMEHKIKYLGKIYKLSI